MMDAAPPAPLPGLDFDLLFAALPAPCAVLSADGTTVLALNAALRRCLPAAPATPAPVAALQAAAAAAGWLPLALAPVPATGPPRYVLGSWPAAAAGPAGEEKTPADWHRQLAAEQARHQYLLDQTPALMASFEGPDHRLGCANARFEGAFGHLARPGTTLAERYPEALAQGFGARLDAVYRSGETVRGDGVPLEAHDPATGQLRRFYFDITCQALRDPAGPITGVLLFAVDVTGRVLAQQAAAAAAAEIQDRAAAAAEADALRLRRMTESQPSTSFTVNADGAVGYVSPQWYAYTGTAAGSDINAVWPTLLHPDDLPAVAAAFGAALASGTPWSYDFRLRGADGRYRWFASQGRPEPLAEAQAAGRPRQWFGSNLDIDDLRQAQAALQAQETRLASILDQLPLTISTIEGLDLRFTFLSAMAKAQMGPRAQVGRPVAECLPEIAAQGYTALLAQVRDTGQPVRGYEERSTLQDPATGELREVFNNFGFLPLHGADGAIAGVLTYGLNVTAQVQSRRAAEVLGVEALRQARDLQALTDAVPSFMYTMRPDGGLDYISGGFYAYTGHDPTAALDTAWDTVHPDDLPAATASFAATVAAGRPWEAQLRTWHAASGAYRWVQTRATPRPDPTTGALLAYSGVSTDIHALRLAQDELAEREAQLRLLAETIPQQVWTVEADGRISYVNQRYTDYTGFDVPALAAQGWNALVHPDDLDRMQADFGQQLATGTDFNLEGRLRYQADGSYRWFLHRAVPQYDAQGNFLRWFGTSTDVQQQHELQERLLRNEAELRLQAESLPQQIWTAGPDGIFDFYNHRTVAYLGTNPAQDAGATWLDCLHPDDRAPAAARWTAALAQGRFYEAEFRIRRYDGTYRWFLAQAQARRDSVTGHVLRWYGTNTDIEDQKRAQYLLVQQNTRLKRTNADLDNFVYTASHDLKQPVTNMAGIFAELARTATFADPDAPRLLAMFDRALTQIYDTIDDLAAIVRVQRPTGVQAFEPVELTDLAAQVAASLHNEATRLGATFTFDFTACRSVRAVRANLQSVFFNLFSNALKYADPARPPRVRAHCAPDPATGRPVLTFADNGLGLDLAQVGAQLFQQFVRFHPHIEGSGMGLYLVNRIVEATGGRLDVQSEVGVGTTFTLYWGE